MATVQQLCSSLTNRVNNLRELKNPFVKTSAATATFTPVKYCTMFYSLQTVHCKDGELLSG